MRLGKRPTITVDFSSALPTLKTDFNTVPDDGLLRSSRVLDSFFVVQVGKGSWVRLVDGDGNSCIARIKKIRGLLFYLDADWSTWRAADEPSVWPSADSALSAPPSMTAATSGEKPLVTQIRRVLAAS